MMTFFILTVSVTLFYWLIIIAAILNRKVSEFTQLESTVDVVIAFVISFVPILNVIVALAVIADSDVRFHK